MTGPLTAPQRMFVHRRILQVTPDAYFAGIRLLAETIRLHLAPATAAIGIANGGLLPAQALGALLDVPVYRVDARHNPTDALYTQATGRVSYDVRRLASALVGWQLAGRTLLVDDICGTGATFDTLRPVLAGYLAPGATAHTVTLCRNASANRDPDLWLWTVDDWVHFSWEAALPGDAVVENLVVPGQVQQR